jgi:hypothetical protein
MIGAALAAGQIDNHLDILMAALSGAGSGCLLLSFNPI